MTRISFLLPTYNRAHLIAESIASVASQMSDEDELLVIDDGSTDQTAQVVRSADARLRYLRQENSGKSAALNRGLGEAAGRLIWICDDDDLMCPGAVHRLVRAIERSGAEFVFGCYTRFRLEKGRKVDLGTGYWPDLSQGSLVRHVLEDAFVMHNAALVRKAAYDRVGPFDETMPRSLDYEMFVRLAVHASMAYEDMIVFEQRKHEGPRGPARLLHAAGRSDSVWKEYDRRIFERLRESLPLAFYETMFDAESDSLRRRAALLQRAAIMGRHDLWDDALDDLEQASGCSPGRALDPVEADICRRVVAGKHAFAGLATGPRLARMKALGRSGAAGHDMTLAVADGTIWRLRQAEGGPRRDALRILGRVAGPAGLFRLARRRLAGRHAAAHECAVVERSDVAPLPPGQPASRSIGAGTED